MTTTELKARILEATGWCPEVLTSREEEAARDFFDTLDAMTKETDSENS